MNDKMIDFDKYDVPDTTIKRWACGLDWSGYSNPPEPEIIMAATREAAFKQYYLTHPSTNASNIVVEELTDGLV